MGGSMARGICSSGTLAPERITIADPSAGVAEAFRTLDSKITVTSDNTVAVSGADMVMIAVKPWVAEETVREVAGAMKPGAILASVVAGVTTDTLRGWLGREAAHPVVRVMPNTAIAISRSMTFIAAGPADTGALATANSLLAPLGEVMIIREEQMAAATALASCGIAYALRYMQAAIEGGAGMGFAPADARRIVMQTVEGALAVLRHNGSDPAGEIAKVTTPGGITLRGLEAMEREGFTRAVISGLEESR